MSLSALPAVLVQSLMHALQPWEMLSLARCSKWTLHCADSAFPWRDCPPLTLMLHSKAARSLLARPSRLARWIPLSLASGDGVCLRDADTACVLQLMQSCPRISLSWTVWELTTERGLELLAHPAMQSVRDLGLAIDIHAEWLAAAARLPCLTHLDLMGSRLSSADLQPLVHARALRLLAVSEERGECLSVVMQLTQLTTLFIHMPRIHGDNFVAFCAAMSGLEELCLTLWRPEDVRSISPADLVMGFTSLRSLRTLKFVSCFDEETLVPVLHRAPRLRHLRLPRLKSDAAVTLVAQLMQLAPLLRIRLVWEEDRQRLEQAKQALLAATSASTASQGSS